MKKIILILMLIVINIVVQGQAVYDYLILARSVSDSRDFDKSIVLLTEALSLKRDYRIYQERASVYLLKGEYNLAIADLLEANSIEDGSGLYGLAEAYALQGDVIPSLKFLEMHFETQFKKEEKEIILDPDFEKVEGTPEWRLFWKKERYSSLETIISEIEFETSQGNIEEAKVLFNQLINKYSGDNILYPKALIAFTEKKYLDASNILLSVPSSELKEKEMRLLAKTQCSNSNFKGAAEVYSGLIKREVPDAELLYLRALCYNEADEHDKAISDLAKYLGLYPENADALRLAGKTESEKGNNIKALEYFSKNIELNPSLPENFIDRGNAYSASSSWKYAIEDYNMALDLDPENSDVYINKGIALISIGKTVDACHDFRQAFKFGNRKAASYISRYCIK